MINQFLLRGYQEDRPSKLQLVAQDRVDGVVRPPFDLSTKSDDWCEFMFRFGKDAIRFIADSLDVGERVRLSNGSVFSTETALCVMLRYLSYPAFGRPSKHQKEVYNGHKRKHSLKYQAVMAADGMFCDVFGPEAGRRHDMYLLGRTL
ncbi:hypothetical protein ATCC90586_008117 [Pythium insidiosum]|nr:hypothetical protein ATCC90586_008117 [Pythium insidiosum]